MSIMFVILVIAIFAIIMKKNRIQLSRRRSNWLTSAYALVLLICAILAPILPRDEVTFRNIDKRKEILESGTFLYTAATEGKIDQIESDYLHKKWYFDYQGEQLSLSLANADFISSQVFIERKSENDGRIEAAYYKTRSYINEMDISKLDNPMRLELTDETLMLNNPKKTVLEFYQFDKAFPIAQFTSEGWEGGHRTSFSQGQSILYIKVPKNLEMINESQINYIIVE